MDRSRSTVPKPEHGPDLSPSSEPPEVGAIISQNLMPAPTMSEGTNPRLAGALLPGPARYANSAPISDLSLLAQYRTNVYARVCQFIAQSCQRAH